MSGSHLPQPWSVGTPPLESYESQDRPGTGNESLLNLSINFAGLLRRNLLVVLGLIGASLATSAFFIHRDQPTYRATAVIRLVNKTRALSGALGAGPGDRLFGPGIDPILSQVQILQSRGVASELAAREGLRLQPVSRGLPGHWLSGISVDPETPSDTLTLTFSTGGVLVRSRRLGEAESPYGAPIQLHGARFIAARQPDVESARLALVPLEAATNVVLENLRGRARERTDIVDVSYSATDPVLAQRVVNSAVQIYKTLNARAAKQESVRRREFVEGRLEKTELMLSEAQLSHNQFRTRERVYSSQEKFKAQQSDLMALELRRQELDADRRIYTSLLDELQNSRASGPQGERLNALAASPGIAANPVVAQLFTQLLRVQAARDSLTTGPWATSSENPDIKRLDAIIASTSSNIVAAVRGQISSVEARLGALDELKDRTSGRLTTLPGTEAEETALLTQVETYRKEADRLREELQKAQIEEAAEAGQVEIVDLATLPSKPIGFGHTPKLVLAFLLGLVLAGIVAYVLENHGAVIRRREELERATPIPNLAIVPRISALNGNGNGHRLLPRISTLFSRNGHTAEPRFPSKSDLVTISDGRSGGAEAYRTLRTNLLFSSVAQTLRRVVITSAGPEEGKSTTAANLAVAYAQQGQRVLLIDCDLRRPRLHKLFQVPHEPGLTNALLGGASLVEAVNVTGVERLSVMTSGVIPPNPAELLGSPQMRELLDTIAMRFDLLVLDSPPLLAASDAAILSRMSDGALLVVRAGKTQRGALQAAIQQLSTVGARVIGTVLNDPDAEVAKYADYYSYYYNKYYSEALS